MTVGDTTTVGDAAMADALRVRLNQILPKITSEKFLGGHGLGNEIAFHIFDYPPEAELQVREHLEVLRGRIPKKKPELKVLHVNLFDFLLDYLSERKLLEKALELQRDKGNEALLKALRGVLNEGKIAQRFGDVHQPAEQGLILISGVGNAYPLLRTHALLSNLQPIVGPTPLVMFYPGSYDKMTLRLFGRVKVANYYRAFRLID